MNMELLSEFNIIWKRESNVEINLSILQNAFRSCYVLGDYQHVFLKKDIQRMETDAHSAELLHP